jgi:hypothetical protein
VSFYQAPKRLIVCAFISKVNKKPKCSELHRAGAKMYTLVKYFLPVQQNIEYSIVNENGEDFSTV